MATKIHTKFYFSGIVLIYVTDQNDKPINITDDTFEPYCAQLTSKYGYDIGPIEVWEDLAGIQVTLDEYHPDIEEEMLNILSQELTQWVEKTKGPITGSPSP